MDSYEFRGVEFHSTRMYESSHVIRTLEFMEKYGMNALIFHKNEMLDEVSLPGEMFTADMVGKYWPVRREHALMTPEYLRWVTKQCRMRNIDFFMEIKEIWYHESLLEMFPELNLMGENASVCPSNPFWPKFVEMRVREAFEKVPDMAGVIVSLGTRESKLSLAANRCHCEDCRNIDGTAWYERIIRAMYGPLEQRGKKLIVRDFSFDPENLNMVVDACMACSQDIIISLKNTPHDFFLTYPTNPRIGTTMGSTQYIEFDAWGQFFGLGLFPVGVDVDMKARLLECREKNARGAYFRTDLEVVRELSCYNSLSMVNLYAAAMLTHDVNTEIDDIYKAWVNDGITVPMIQGSFGQVPAKPTAPDAWRRFRDFMHMGWTVMEKTYYVRGQTFLCNGLVPNTLSLALSCLSGRSHWEPEIIRLLDRTDENVRAIIAEKDEALELVKGMVKILDLDTVGLHDDVRKNLEELCDLYVWYVRLIRAAAILAFRGLKAVETRNSGDISNAKRALEDIYDLERQLQERMEGTDYPHYVYWHFFKDRHLSLARDVETQLAL